MATLQEVIDALNNVASQLGSAPSPGGDPATAAARAEQMANDAERRALAAQSAVDLNATELEQLAQQQNLTEAILAATEAQIEAETLRAKADGEYTQAQAAAMAERQALAQDFHAQEVARIAERSTEAAEAAKEQEEGIKRATGLAVGLGKSFGLAANFQQSLIGGWATMAEEIANNVDAADAMNDQLRETFSAANIGASTFAKVLEMSLASAAAYDSATADFNKATGAAGRFNEEMTDTTVGLASMGVGIEDATAAYGALFSEMSNFTNLSKAERMVLGEVVSSLDGLGISAELTATNLEFLTQTMGMSAQQAADQQIKLAEFANTIGVAPAKMADEFKAAQPIMAKFGQEVGDKMFKKLAETAKATGVEMSALLGIASQFDTYDSAAQAAGKLNALLGGPMLNSVELLTANEAERIEMLRQGVQQSGKSWASMNQFERQAIASAAGISDMTEAAKLFGTTDQEFAANAEEQANMAEMSAKAQSAQEKLNTLMMQFAAHVAPVVELFSDFLTKVLETIDAMGWFGKVITTTILGLGLLQMAISAYNIVKEMQIVLLVRSAVAQTWAATKTLALATATGIGTVAQGLWNIVTAIGSGVATAFGTAVTFATWPLLLIVVAIAAATAAIVGLIFYWDELTASVKNSTDGLYDMWDVLLLVAAVVAAPFSILAVSIGAVVLAGKKLYENWDMIVTSGRELWSGFTGFFTNQIDIITSGFEYMGRTISDMWDGVTDKINHGVSAIVSGFKSVINEFINLYNNTLGNISFTVPGWDIFGAMGGQSIGPLFDPIMPMLAEGGTITASGAAIVGEKGPEIVNLPKGASVQPTKPTAPSSTGGGGPTTVKLILNDREFAKAVIKVVNERMNLRTG